VYSGGSANTKAFVRDTLHAMFPESWLRVSDEVDGVYRVGQNGIVELASIRERKRRPACDVSAVLDYAAGSERQVEAALRMGTVHLLSGEPPTSRAEQWVLAYRDAARAGDTLFRFRRKPDAKRDALVKIIDSSFGSDAKTFWES